MPKVKLISGNCGAGVSFQSCMRPAPHPSSPHSGIAISKFPFGDCVQSAGIQYTCVIISKPKIWTQKGLGKRPRSSGNCVQNACIQYTRVIISKPKNWTQKGLGKRPRSSENCVQSAGIQYARLILPVPFTWTQKGVMILYCNKNNSIGYVDAY